MNEQLQQGLNIEGGPPLHGTGSAEELAKSESERIKTFYQTILSVLVVFIVAALSGYKDIKELYSTTNHKKVHLSNLLVAEGLLLIMTFLCAVVLMMFEFFVYQYGRQGRSWYRVVTILVAVTGTMLIAANTVLVIITNRNNTALSVVLAPVLVLVSVAVRTGAWMEEERSATLGSRYDMVMKGTFDMATIGTMASFALQGTVAFGYLKTPDNNQGKGDLPLDLAVCYATSTFSLLMMMICAMPLVLLPANMLEDLIRVVERLRHVVLAALAVMALVVSVEFLEGFVVLSVCPEVSPWSCITRWSSSRVRPEGGACHGWTSPSGSLPPWDSRSWPACTGLSLGPTTTACTSRPPCSSSYWQFCQA